MNLDSRPSARAMRCSAVTQLMQGRPAATAGSFDSVLLIDRPLPWARDVSEDPSLAPVFACLRAGHATTGRTRVQAVVPIGSTDVTLYRRPAGPFAAYTRIDSSTDSRSSIDRAVALLNETDPASSRSGPETRPITEILVCTHGKRDACCGSLGPAVHRALSEIYAVSGDVRIRRTSHLGGHRFAPTVALMPTGTLWAWVDADLVQGIVEQTVPVDRAVRHFRGTMGLDTPELQALDAVLLAQNGWPWLGRPRTGAVIERDGREALVRLEHKTADGRWTSTATVVCTKTSPIPACGVPLDGTEKTQPEWTVTGLTSTQRSPSS